MEQHASNENSRRKANALRVALKSVSATDLVATLGFSCYIVWELLGVFDTLPFIAPAFPADRLPLLRVCLFLSLSIGFFAATKAAMRVRRQARLFLTLGAGSTILVLAFALASTAVADPPLWLGIVAWSVFGVSLTGLMAAWAVYFSTRFGATTPLVITAGYAVGFALFLLLSALAPTGGAAFFLFVGVMVAVSTIGFLAFLLLAQPQAQKAEDAGALAPQPQTGRIAPPRMPFARALHATAYGVSYGFTITFLLSTGTASAVIGAVGGLAGCVTALIALSHNRLATGSDIRRITFIPVAVALLFLPIGAPLSYILCSLPIIAATIFTAVTSWVAVALDVDRKGYDPVTAFASNKWPGWFGFFLGTFASTIVIEAAPSLFTVVVAGLVAFICVSFAVFELRIYEDRHDEAKDRGHDRDDEGTDGPNGGITHEKRFQTRCDGIVRAYGLSPRESEVFRLLAKGRNAEYISQELCIARPTTKTHIQHIYQKLTINSHQELIDLIDNRE